MANLHGLLRRSSPAAWALCLALEHLATVPRYLQQTHPIEQPCTLPIPPISPWRPDPSPPARRSASSASVVPLLPADPSSQGPAPLRRASVISDAAAHEDGLIHQRRRLESSTPSMCLHRLQSSLQRPRLLLPLHFASFQRQRHLAAAAPRLNAILEGCFQQQRHGFLRRLDCQQIERPQNVSILLDGIRIRPSPLYSFAAGSDVAFAR